MLNSKRLEISPKNGWRARVAGEPTASFPNWREQLRLELHPDKVSIKTLSSGVDFLGWVHFPDHRVLRTVTKKRMLRRIEESASHEATVSYLGLLGHGNTHKLGVRILRQYEKSRQNS